MKKVIALLVLVLCVGQLTASAQEKNPDSLIRKIFNAISNGDKASFLKTFPDYNQMRRIISEVMSKADTLALEKEYRDHLAGFTEEMFRFQLLPEFEKEYNKILAQLKEKAIRPEKMKFIHAEYASRNLSELGMPQVIANGKIYFRVDTTQYVLPFSDMIWSEDLQGYFGVSLKPFRGRWEPDFEEMETELSALDSVEIRDVIIQSVQEKDAPPPPPAKKPGQKPPVKKPARTNG
jgi:hypothetical protein